MANTDITVEDFTSGSVDGTGVFDVMTASMLNHLKAEFKAGRITGPEYSSVYLGALQGTQALALEFLLKKDETSYKLQLLEIELAKAEIEKETLEAQKELIEAQVRKIEAEIARIELETGLIEAQIAKMTAEVGLIEKQALKVVEETTLIIAQESKVKEEEVLVEAQQVTEEKQACKLMAEYDVLMLTKGKITAETEVLSQKKTTEAAQTQGEGVADKSVIGRQMQLYKSQSDGFLRDAEQKSAKIMADTWSVRRTTDETGTQGNETNSLWDESVGQAVNTMLAGVESHNPDA